MKLINKIGSDSIRHLPAGCHWLQIVEKQKMITVNRYVYVKKYQSYYCSVYYPPKRVSRLYI